MHVRRAGGSTHVGTMMCAVVPRSTRCRCPCKHLYERSMREGPRDSCKARACTHRTPIAPPRFAYFHATHAPARVYRRKRRTTRHVWRVSAAHAPLTTHSPRRTLAAHGIHVVYMLLSSSRMYQRSPYDVVIHVRRTAVQCVSVLTAAGYLGTRR